MSAGYSGTPLAKKLGFTPGALVTLINEPTGFRALVGSDSGMTYRTSGCGQTDIVVVFVTERDELRRRSAGLGRAIFPDGAIWVAWPKKASKVPTDITEDVVREVVLPLGLVDNKVCAIDETWSGLRVVWRKEHRGGPVPP